MEHDPRRTDTITLGCRLSGRLAATSGSAVVLGGTACAVAIGDLKLWIAGTALLAFGLWRISYLIPGRTSFVLRADDTLEWRVGGWGRRIPLSTVVRAAAYGAALDFGWPYGLQIEWLDGDGRRRRTLLPDVFEERPEQLAQMIVLHSPS